MMHASTLMRQKIRSGVEIANGDPMPDRRRMNSNEDQSRSARIASMHPRRVDAAPVRIVSPSGPSTLNV